MSPFPSSSRLAGLALAAAGFVAIAGCGRPSTYAAACSPPRPGCLLPGNGWHNLVQNRLRIAEDGTLIWNGAEVSRPRLQSYLAMMPELSPPVATVLEVHPSADCAVVRTIRQDMDEILACASTQLCGEGTGEWESGPFINENSAAYQEMQRAADRAANHTGKN